jgi:murein endopeptidase
MSSELSNEAANTARSLLSDVGKLVTPSSASSDRVFFPNGIQLIQVIVKIAGVDIELTVSGVPKAATTALAPATAASATFELLPQVSGHGYYPYSSVDRQFGTHDTITAIVDVGDTVQLNQPGFPFGVGDISLVDGSPMSPHQGHRLGRNVDIRPMRKDQTPQPVKYTDPDYDRDATKLIIDSFLAHANVDFILFNDTSIPNVRPFQGHDDHFHVQMKS